jgi:hypothetical protein
MPLVSVENETPGENAKADDMISNSTTIDAS